MVESGPATKAERPSGEPSRRPQCPRWALAAEGAATEAGDRWRGVE